MKKTSLLLLATSLFSALLISPQVSAYEPGDIIVRFGGAMTAPQEDSSNLKLNGASLANSGVGVDNDTQFGITLEYMINAHVGIELLASTPFEHDLTAKLNGNNDLGSIKHLPPTLTVLWHPFKADAKLQPYAGIGINYTIFFDEDESNYLGAKDLQLDDSVGLALRAGFDYQLNDRWLINAGVWYLDIETDASLTATALSNAKVKVNVDIDPMVYMIGLGYKF